MKSALLSFLLLFCLTACEQNSQQSASDGEPLVKEKLELLADPSEQLSEVEVSSTRIFDQNSEFEDFKDNFLKAYWKLHPSSAVYAGYYAYDYQLLVPNGELRAQRRAFFVNELRSLKGFDANQLSASNATDWQILDSRLRAKIWYIDGYRSYEWNPAIYNPAGALGLILSSDYKSLSERRDVVYKYLANFADYYAAAKQNIKVPTKQHTELALTQSQGTLNLLQKTLPATFASLFEEIDDNAAQQSDASQLDPEPSEEGLVNEEVVAEPETETSIALTNNVDDVFNTRLQKAVAAVQDYRVYLQTMLDQPPEQGWRDFRIGEELYEKKFVNDIESQFSAAELYQRALKAKQDLHADMVEITEGLWPTYFADTDMPQDKLLAVKQLIDHLSTKHVTRDQFVDEIKRQIPELEAFVEEKQLLDQDPTRPLVVRLTPEYQRGIAGASINPPGPYDATANTYYNVSPLDAYTDEQAESYLREYNHWIIQILNIHEAIPGHYTQLMHANKSPSKIKSIFANGAMIEGWAVYAERMMLENGYAENEPEMQLMYSKWNMRVVMNTIIDYSVQVLGMERQAALDLMINEAFQERTEAEGKWRRATLSQVQLTSYYNGFAEILALREEVKTLLGDKFSLRDFHNSFLSYGNAPVALIGKLMLSDLRSRLDTAVQ